MSLRRGTLAFGAIATLACTPQAPGPLALAPSPEAPIPSLAPSPGPTTAWSVAPAASPSVGPSPFSSDLRPLDGAVGMVGALMRYEELLYARGAQSLGLRVPEGLQATPAHLAAAAGPGQLRLLSPGVGRVNTALGGWAPLLVQVPGHEPLPWLRRSDLGNWSHVGEEVNALDWLASEADWRAWWVAYWSRVWHASATASFPPLPAGFDWAMEGMLVFRHRVGHAGELPFLAELPEDGALSMDVVVLDSAPLPTAVGHSVLAFRLPQAKPWRSLQMRHSQGRTSKRYPIPEGGASGAWPELAASMASWGDASASGDAVASAP